MSIEGLQVFSNDERTRTFLALGVAVGRDQVLMAVMGGECEFNLFGHTASLVGGTLLAETGCLYG